MFIKGERILPLMTEVASRLAKLNTRDPGYQAKAIEVTYAVVDAFSKEAPLSPLQREKLAAKILQGAAGCLVGMNAEGLLQAQAAATLLDQTKEILRREQLVLARFGTVATGAAPLPCPPRFVEVLAAYSGFAATMGTPIAHDAYVRFEAAHTVQGARANNVGEYGKRQREHMIPYDVVLEKAGSPYDNSLQNIISLNREGIRGTLLGLVDAAQELGSGPSENYRQWCESLPNHFSIPQADFVLSPEIERYLHRMGAELRDIHDQAQHDPSKIDWTKYPHAFRALSAAHNRWVQNNRARAGAVDLKPFEELDPRTQARNIPIVLASIVGVLNAHDSIVDIVKKGIIYGNGAVSDAGFNLQMHLAASARAALADEELDPSKHAQATSVHLPNAYGADSVFSWRNQVHARAVADEASVLLLHAAQVADLGVLSKVHTTIEQACRDAGDRFLPGGKGASDAPKAARARIGELLHVFYPQMDVEACQHYAEDLLRRSTIDDIADLMSSNFRRQRVSEQGQGLITKLKEVVPKDDYFYQNIDTLPIRSGPAGFNDLELRDLGTLLRLYNATWKQGQVHRVVNKGNKDWSRTSPFERGAVYNPYDLLVTPVGTDYIALFVVIKDLDIAQRELKGP